LSYPGRAAIPNGWGATIYSTADGTRPVTAMGTAVTPGNLGYGSFVSLISGANLTVDCCDLTIAVCNVSVSTQARDCVVALGVDPAGGTSFTSVADLVCGPASGYFFSSTGMGGTIFRFPYWIRAGASIGVAASVNSATLTALNAFCRVRGAPSRPEQIYVGTYIDQFGVSLATAAGTTITPGTTSEGAYVSLGTLTRPIYAWEFGMGVNDSTMTINNLDVDIAIGDGTNRKIAIPNALVGTSALESISKLPALEYCTGAVGDQVWARAQSATALDSNYSIAVYGVGG
jgi:hypothetical protein